MCMYWDVDGLSRAVGRVKAILKGHYPPARQVMPWFVPNPKPEGSRLGRRQRYTPLELANHADQCSYTNNGRTPEWTGCLKSFFCDEFGCWRMGGTIFSDGFLLSGKLVVG